MPSFQDSAVIFFLALLLFGPKKLPELARYVGKLMGEFRRASNEFRMQMEDELRVADQAEAQKKIAAMEAAAPIAPPLNIPEPEHPHTPRMEPAQEQADEHHIEGRPDRSNGSPSAEIHASAQATPLPIASAGTLEMMPPATGLPVARSSVASSVAASSVAAVFESIPHTADQRLPAATSELSEATPNA